MENSKSEQRVEEASDVYGGELAFTKKKIYKKTLLYYQLEY